MGLWNAQTGVDKTDTPLTQSWPSGRGTDIPSADLRASKSQMTRLCMRCTYTRTKATEGRCGGWQGVDSARRAAITDRGERPHNGLVGRWSPRYIWPGGPAMVTRRGEDIFRIYI